MLHAAQVLSQSRVHAAYSAHLGGTGCVLHIVPALGWPHMLDLAWGGLVSGPDPDYGPTMHCSFGPQG